MIAPSRTANLIERYGSLMTSQETSTELMFPSRDALRVAVARGRIVLKPIKVSGRRPVFYSTVEVARLLDSWIAEGSNAPNGGAV